MLLYPIRLLLYITLSLKCLRNRISSKMFINLLKLNILFGQKVICFYSQYKYIVEKKCFFSLGARLLRSQCLNIIENVIIVESFRFVLWYAACFELFVKAAF